jgi:integrase
LQDLAKPLANRPIAEITPAELLDLLKRVEKSGRRESARRLRGVIGSVFRLAVVSLRATTDPTFNSAFRRMGFTQEEMSAHGFRSSASRILNENEFNPDVIEAALGHQAENAVRRAYNRAIYWPERIALMQKWADMLDDFRALDAPKSGRRP